MAFYEEDLSYIQAAAFGSFAAGAMPAIIARLHKAPLPVSRVVDVGCGAGVSTRSLTDAGFDVLAIEPSPALLEIARAAAPAARFRNESAYDAALSPCEAILAIGEPLTYHSTDVDADALLQRFFRSAAAVLASGGQFIFDVIVTDGASLDAKGWNTGSDWAILHETREDPRARRLTRTIETFRKDGEGYRRGREIHEVRLFEETAVRSWLDGAGFDVETSHAYGTQRLGPRRVAFFATRR
jgi:SAM-dependent methyltransferase